MGGVAKRYRALVRRVPVQIEANPDMQYSTLEWSQVGTIFIVCIRPERVPSDVWARYINDLAKKPVTKLLGIALSSADVTSVQRKEMFDLVKQRGLQCACVTDDKLVRGIVTAASWVGVDARAFAWANLRESLSYLGLPKAMLDRGVEEVMRLKERCTTPLPIKQAGT